MSGLDGSGRTGGDPDDSRLSIPYPDKVSTMTDVQIVTLPTKIDADVTMPDGSTVLKVRVVYRGDGVLQGVSLGAVVIGPTTIDGPVGLLDNGVYRVPTPDGVYLMKRRRGCGCGG